MNSESLRAKITTLTDLIKSAEHPPRTLSSQLLANSLKAQREDALKELQIAFEVHSKEVIEVHLSGKRAGYSNIPLRIFGQVSSAILNGIMTASTRIYSGRDYRKIPQKIEELMNLRLVSLTGGSTKVYLTADPSVDMFGNSLSETTLKNIFKTLETNSTEELVDTFEEIGIKSLKQFHSLFSVLTTNKIDLGLSWTNVEMKQFAWHASVDELKTWKKRIEQISSQQLPSENISGVISLMSLSGRLEINTEENGKIRATYPSKLFEGINKYSIGDQISGSFDRYNIIDLAKGIVKIQYQLSKISE